MFKCTVPVVGMLVSSAAMLVSFLSAGTGSTDAETLASRLAHADERRGQLQAHLGGEEAFLVQAAGRSASVQAAAAQLSAPIAPLEQKALTGAVTEVLEANWPLFIHRFCLANGSIGTLANTDEAAVKAAEKMLQPDLKRLGLAPKDEGRVLRALAETSVLFAKARQALYNWPAAIDLERRRLIDEATQRLQRILPAHHTEKLRRMMEEKLR